jgi:hypothetical protein
MVDDNRFDFTTSGGRNAMQVRPSIDDSGMVKCIMIANVAVTENGVPVAGRHPETVDMMVPEMIIGDERETPGRQAKIKVHSHPGMVISPAHAHFKYRARRQWSPSAIGVMIAPAHP